MKKNTFALELSGYEVKHGIANFVSKTITHGIFSFDLEVFVKKFKENNDTVTNESVAKFLKSYIQERKIGVNDFVKTLTESSSVRDEYFGHEVSDIEYSFAGSPIYDEQINKLTEQINKLTEQIKKI